MEAGQVSDSWERGSSYEQYVGRWSRQVAPRFLDWLEPPPGLRWLDLGCGTCALSAAILDHCAPARVVGVDPSAGFLETAAANMVGRVDLRRGSAAAIPLADAEVDVVASALLLNFVSDPAAALAEMARVTGPGGCIAAYVWDYAGRMDLMRHFWDAAVELDPAAAALDEGVRFPGSRREALLAQFTDAGFAQPMVAAIDIQTPFASFDAYWQPFLGGQGPAPAYAMSLSDAGRGRLRERLQQRVRARPDGSLAFTARVWAARGTVPG
jgi:SAM-dependent methyltransferase